MAKIKTIRIEARADDKYKVAVKAGERTLYVDQPLFVGGTDAGASPMEYLVSSLAGCIATTARIIANQKKLDLNGMDSELPPSKLGGFVSRTSSADRLLTAGYAVL